MSSITIRDLRKVYKTAGVVALDGVSFEVRAGEAVAIIGPSGAGKTTLFRALTRTITLDSGSVEIGGIDLYKAGYLALAPIRKKIGRIYQKHNLVGELSVLHNVQMGVVGSRSTWQVLKGLAVGLSSDERERVRRALEEVGLPEKMPLKAANLSGGEQQRVAIARLLVQDPDVVLADEPVASIDPASSERIMETFARLNGAGKTVVCNIHDVELASKWFDRIVALATGRIVYDGKPSGLTAATLSSIYEGGREVEEEGTDRSCACIEMMARKGFGTAT
ncbi:MAG: phosphonate ABC transporter ATP-binding protein [Candidatus Aquicultorales bacterium]